MYIVSWQICLWLFNSYLQEASTQVESQLVDLKTMLERQEDETRKDDSKFKFRLDENDKLEVGFATERSTWDEERAALIQRAETAESSLKEATSELTGLKCYISQMTIAIFGK